MQTRPSMCSTPMTVGQLINDALAEATFHQDVCLLDWDDAHTSEVARDPFMDDDD